MEESYAEQYKQIDTETPTLEWFKMARLGFDQSLIEGNYDLAGDIIKDTIGVGLEWQAKDMMEELSAAIGESELLK